MSNIQEVPFRVSARTARLIGRENVATAESAISELVKNSYDANASFCIVRISPTYSGVPEAISKDEFDRLADWGLNPENHYDLSGETASLRPCLADEHSPEAELIRNLVTITVIDDGSGMGNDAIREAWMVIGTANKELESSSKLGRARTGAKGIGRFALDRLGAQCQLHSSTITEVGDSETSAMGSPVGTPSSSISRTGASASTTTRPSAPCAQSGSGAATGCSPAPTAVARPSPGP